MCRLLRKLFACNQSSATERCQAWEGMSHGLLETLQRAGLGTLPRLWGSTVPVCPFPRHSFPSCWARCASSPLLTQNLMGLFVAWVKGVTSSTFLLWSSPYWMKVQVDEAVDIYSLHVSELLWASCSSPVKWHDGGFFLIRWLKELRGIIHIDQ